MIAACQAERRCLITLDLDFSNPLLFPPSDYAGVAVLRLPRKPRAEDLWACCRMLINALAKRDIAGRLWVVQTDRIREYQPDSDEN